MKKRGAGYASRTFSIVDVETTGLSNVYDRVIEIAVIRVEGGKIVKSFQSLINPQRAVSDTIEGITGISRDDLLSAPLFEDKAQEINELLDGAVFTAHNARFDYGFVKNELKRAGIQFNAKCLCSVRLSKKLYSKYKKHDLSSIIERYDLDCVNRHRAFDDALIIEQFLNISIKQKGEEDVMNAIDELLQTHTMPQYLDVKTIMNLPETSGVYLFYGENDELLYIGKSKNLRYRVLSHFSNDHRATKEMTMCQQTKRVEIRETFGELGALLLESRLIKEMNPTYNRMLRRKSVLVIAEKLATDDYHGINLRRVDQIDKEEYANVLSVFKSFRQAKEFLSEIADEHRLCPKLLGLEKSKGSCFYHQLEKCNGACINKEQPEKYNERFDEAFRHRRIKAWPYDMPIVIEEKKNDLESELFYLDHWCLIGEAKGDEDNREFRACMADFDYDRYKIFARYILDPMNRRNIKLAKDNYGSELSNHMDEQNGYYSVIE